MSLYERITGQVRMMRGYSHVLLISSGHRHNAITVTGFNQLPNECSDQPLRRQKPSGHIWPAKGLSAAPEEPGQLWVPQRTQMHTPMSRHISLHAISLYFHNQQVRRRHTMRCLALSLRTSSPLLFYCLRFFYHATNTSQACAIFQDLRSQHTQVSRASTMYGEASHVPLQSNYTRTMASS